jgi:hypothetical protein
MNTTGIIIGAVIIAAALLDALGDFRRWRRLPHRPATSSGADRVVVPTGNAMT